MTNMQSQQLQLPLDLPVPPVRRRRDTRWLSIPLKDWPTCDQSAWSAACAPGDILEPGGIAAGWASGTRHTTRDGYGRWLFWLDSQGLLNAEVSPADRVTREAVSAYAANLKTRVSPYTVAAYIQQLADALRAMAEECDWGWIMRASSRIREGAVPVRDKRSRLQSPHTLANLGRTIMAEADDRHDGDIANAALDYRTGLMIAFLAYRPLRVSNLAAMTLGRHLICEKGMWRVAFVGHETKNRRPLEFPFPRELVPFLEHYLDVYRPALLGSDDKPGSRRSGPLWPTNKGNAVGVKTIGHHIGRRTKAAFGQEINPHLFRDCAATMIAIVDPEHARIIATILGHSTFDTSERHYNLAQGLEAGRRYEKTIKQLEKTSPLPRRLRGSTALQSDGRDNPPTAMSAHR